MATTLPPDPYKLLGVSKDAKLPEIRSAHRKLVLKCHPDKVQDAALKAIKQEEFQQVQQAYETLSDETRRMQYDDQVKLFELRKEMGRGNPTPRSNPFEFQVRTAEPRPNSYERPAPAANVYTYPTGVPRSHEHLYEEPLRNIPKKSPSYDSSDRRRRDEEKRDEEERYKQREKESKRSAHSKKEKSRDKDRRRGAEEKIRSRGGVGAYVEDDSDDDFRPPPPRSSEKKSSRHRIEEEIRMREEEARAARERAAAAEAPRIKEIPLDPKWDEHKDRAAKYMQAARRKVGAEDNFAHPGMRRAETFAPTTAAYNVHYAAPPPGQYSDDEAPRRSSARPKEGRRASDTPRKEKPSRRSPVANEYIVSPPSPPPTRKPSLQSYSSAPPAAAEFMRSKPAPSRSKTQDYPRHEPMPPLPRASTFQSGDRGRDRGSRLKKEVTSDSESDSPIYPSARHSHSPPRRHTQTRYVYENGATVPVQPSSRHRSDLHDLNDSYPRDRSESPHGTPTRPPLSRNPGSDPRTRAHSSQYYGAPPVGPEPIIHTVRPKMSPRTDSHRSSSRTVPQFYGEVKYSQGFNNR
ncbi:DnaJ-domain-containing protein [Stipitochalara longipes BDJ]|nr:DnaJ-domain-containing protein [Stipitochalara longipes BDJ]